MFARESFSPNVKVQSQEPGKKISCSKEKNKINLSIYTSLEELQTCHQHELLDKYFRVKDCNVCCTANDGVSCRR